MKSVLRINIDPESSLPKYRQIINSILQMLHSGSLSKGDRIPSLNELCKQHGLSQDTVLTAYNELKNRGIITSSVGKGYFIQNIQVENHHKVFMLFSKLTPLQESVYESFSEAMKGKGVAHLYFHFNNPKVFGTLISSAINDYTEYVIVPVADKATLEILDKLPTNKTFILDQGRTYFGNKYPRVCQDFERDIYRILKSEEKTIREYDKLVLVNRNDKPHLKEITKGFKDYCKQHPIPYEVITDASLLKIRLKQALIIVDDHDLISIVKQVKTSDLKLGLDLGILSYNESPLKEVISSGISTISTDFSQMGRKMAEMILSGKKEHIDNPFKITKRTSF